MDRKSSLGLWGPLSVLCVSCLVSPAAAHHSTAMYDYSKSQTIVGTVKVWQYTNPHAFLQILVPDGKGGANEWSIEAGTASARAASRGWTRDAFKPGDKVTAVVAPMRNGTHGGTMRTVTFADGRMLRSLTADIGADTDGKPGFNLGLPEIKRATPKAPAGQSK